MKHETENGLLVLLIICITVFLTTLITVIFVNDGVGKHVDKIEQKTDSILNILYN